MNKRTCEVNMVKLKDINLKHPFNNSDKSAPLLKNADSANVRAYSLFVKIYSL